MKNYSNLIQYSVGLIFCGIFTYFLGIQKAGTDLIVPFSLFFSGCIASVAGIVSEINKLVSSGE